MEINKTFVNFFQKLYSSEASGDTSHQTTLLNNIQIPSLSDEARKHLDSSLSVEELLKAISTMKNGKTARPDGLPIDIFKAFKERLVQPLMNMFEESLENGILPPSLR